MFIAFAWGPNSNNNPEEWADPRSRGGWDHYVGEGTNLTEAKCALFEAIEENEAMQDQLHHGHIVDISTKKIVYTWSK